MSLCNVVSCMSCSLATTRPFNCPISSSLGRNIPTLIFNGSDSDKDSFLDLGKAAFESERFDEVCFVECSCLSGNVVSDQFSLNKFSPNVRAGAHYGLTDNSRERRTVQGLP